MPEQTFIYKALDQKGSIKKGRLQAAHQQGAFTYIKDRGLHVLSLYPVGQGVQKTIQHFFWKRLSNHELLMMVTQLHTMIQARLPLIEALSTLREIYGDHFLGNILERVEGDVLRGEPLSKALSFHPQYFDSILISTVAQGEENNRLSAALFHYKTHLSQRITLKTNVRKAIAYPIFLTIAFSMLLIFLSIFLLPSMATFMAQNTPQNEGPIGWLLAVQFLEAYGILILSSLALLTIVLYGFSMIFDNFKLSLSHLRLKLPFIGEILYLENLRLFVQGLELLCRDGHDLPRSLTLAHGMIQSPFLQKRMAGLGAFIDQGQSLYTSLNGFEFIPPVALRMIKVGEQTGQLPWAFEQIGQYLNTTLMDKINRMGRILEPLLLLMMGGILLIIVLGIFMPLYSHLGEFN